MLKSKVQGKSSALIAFALFDIMIFGTTSLEGQIAPSSDSSGEIISHAFNVPAEQKSLVRRSLVTQLENAQKTIQSLVPKEWTTFSVAEDGTLTGTPPAMLSSTKLAKIEATAEVASATANALNTIDGTPPDNPMSLQKAAEAFIRVQRQSWVICQSQAWVPANPPQPIPLYSYLAARQTEFKVAAMAAGLLSTYDVIGPGKLRVISNAGTAVAIGPHTLLTNRHVVEEAGFARLNAAIDGQWVMDKRIVARVHFPIQYDKCQPAKAPSASVTIDRVIYADAKLDFAVLHTIELISAILPLPDEVIDLDASDALVVVGYPGRPTPSPSFSDQLIDQMCGTPTKKSPFVVERASPGLFMQNVADDGSQEFAHDATTSGGSSGSPIISLANGQFIGIQYSGLESASGKTGYNLAVRADVIRNVLRTRNVAIN